MAKTAYTCQYCGKSPIMGYQAHTRHERQCSLNPNKPIPPTESHVPGAQGLREPLQDVATPVPGGNEGKKADSVPVLTIEERFAALELSMGQRMQNSLDAIRASFDSVPQQIATAVDSSVNNYMQAKLGGPSPAAAAEVPGYPGPGAEIPGAAVGGALEILPPGPPPPNQPPKTGLAAMFSGINIEGIALAWLQEQGDGDINKAIFNLTKRYILPSTKAPAPADPKYSSRGMSFFLSAIRNKKADADAQATTLRSLATQMLGDKNLDSGNRSYYAGIKAAADAYMEGRQLETVKEAAAAKPPAAISGPPAEVVPAPVPHDNSKGVSQ